MTNFTIQVHDQAVQAALQTLADRIANPGPMLGAIGEDIVTRAKARFDSSTAPDGTTWKPKKKPDGRKTLVGDTGDLRRQIVRQVSGNAVTILAATPYSAIHQFGGPIQRKAGEITTRHRTDAKGELLRSKIMSGKGLIFAKASHKRQIARTFAHGAYTINIPPRPYLPVHKDGSLYPGEQRLILDQINAWLAGRLGA